MLVKCQRDSVHGAHIRGRMYAGDEALARPLNFRIDACAVRRSADAIAGRKPYGIATRMMHCEGWKRRALNSGE